MQRSFDLVSADNSCIQIAKDSWLLKGFATARAATLLRHIAAVTAEAPLRHQVTARGHNIAVAMSNCGRYGWLSDQHGYRYDSHDPQTHQPWPSMPEVFCELASAAARAAGYDRFAAQACLINRYQRGQGMGLHQDRDEKDLSAPIVSVSLGAPILFLFGGLRRQDKPRRWLLEHGDVVVWGGASRLAYHGVAPLGRNAEHPLTGPVRYNLTFRRVT